jgi:hypothetical protein
MSLATLTGPSFESYRRTLFGRAADNNPMPNLVEWQVVRVDELKQRGLEPGEVVEANKGVRVSALSELDGNKVWLIGGFESSTDGV